MVVIYKNGLIISDSSHITFSWEAWICKNTLPVVQKQDGTPGKLINSSIIATSYFVFMWSPTTLFYFHLDWLILSIVLVMVIINELTLNHNVCLELLMVVTNILMIWSSIIPLWIVWVYHLIFVSHKLTYWWGFDCLQYDGGLTMSVLFNFCSHILEIKLKKDRLFSSKNIALVYPLI